MEIREIEMEYLKNNRPFKIEKVLLESFSKEDIKEFISPLYQEYSYIDECIKRNSKETLLRYPELDEISQYFIQKVIEMKCEGERKEELEIILKKFNAQLISRRPIHKYTRKKVNIEDIDIIAIISKYIQLPKSITRNIPCPFPHHEDKHPSFKIYPKTNSFYCFGCGCGGNVLNFLSYMEEITTKEAYKRIQDLV